MENIQEKAEYFRIKIQNLRNEISKVIVGEEDVIKQVLITILAGGHALLEGVPGIGKTLLVKTISQCLDLKFSRIQFTPDLMPSDIIGTNVVNIIPDGRKVFEFYKGPIFGNIILADEINRATAKTQSALLEAMQEMTVTVGEKTYFLPQPFFVLATQNPIEMEGTYPLPEAQIDRFFFKIELTFPTSRELLQILNRTTEQKIPSASKIISGEEVMKISQLAREVPIAEHVLEYAVKLVLATHPTTKESPEMVKKYVRYGSSPRGAQALVLAGKILALMNGRYNVSFSDIQESAYPALRHRIILNFLGEAEKIKPSDIIDNLLMTLKPYENIK